MHRSRVCYVTMDTNDLASSVAFWSAALGVDEDPVGPASAHIYARLRGGLGGVSLLFQLVPELKATKNRVHLDIETDNVEAEVRRLEALGATRLRNVEERGFSFWVLQDPSGNEFCVIQPEYPELLARGRLWTEP